MQIRLEQDKDLQGIRDVNVAAFGTPLEANLTDTLRREVPVVSLVAEDAGVIVGHILFSPVIHSAAPVLRAMALAPMAVMPNLQRTGIGSSLVRAGLDECRARGIDAVVVVGHAEFYPRFGFDRASRFGISCEFDVPDDVFMALELAEGVLRGIPGTIRFHEAFAGV